MTRAIRYVVVSDHSVMELGNLPNDKLKGWLDSHSEQYRDVFYLDHQTGKVTIVKGKVNLEYLNR